MVFVSFSNKSDTLPLATRYNIKCVGLSPDGRLAIIVDEGKGRGGRTRVRRWQEADSRPAEGGAGLRHPLSTPVGLEGEYAPRIGSPSSLLCASGIAWGAAGIRGPWVQNSSHTGAMFSTGPCCGLALQMRHVWCLGVPR